MSDDGDPSSKPPSPAPAPRMTRSEWALVFILAAIQFTHMVDFVIIMPLGERVMRELALTASQFGWVVSAYAIAAGVASLVAATVMDRFDRKRVLLVMYAGFAVSTLLCGFAESYAALLAARTLAGAFGGVSAVVIMAIIGDVFPAHRRGQATGAVMSSFAVASIAGLPAGLYLAAEWGRGAPFLALAALSAGVWVGVLLKLPSLTGHREEATKRHVWKDFAAVARKPIHLKAFLFTFTLVLGTYTAIPFIGPYLTLNNGVTEKNLALMYSVAGVLTLIGMNVMGRLSDTLPRVTLFRVLAFGAMIVVLVLTNLPAVSLWVIIVVVSLFMVCAAGRMVPIQAILVGVAEPRYRGAFLSLNTAVQHLATGVAPMLAGMVVVKTDTALLGYPTVGVIAACCAVASIVLAGWLKPDPKTLPQPPKAQGRASLGLTPLLPLPSQGRGVG
jgi:DHA1 family inner membrane transport protein